MLTDGQHPLNVVGGVVSAVNSIGRVDFCARTGTPTKHSAPIVTSALTTSR